MIKNRKYRLILSVVLWCTYAPLLCAQDTIFAQIDTIWIQDTSSKLPLNQRSQSWNHHELAEQSASDLGTLLSRESNVFIKSYGSGSLSTATVRGGNAGHTSVLWNGLNIQSPTLGLSDISLLPIGLFDEVVLHKGGASSEAGDGAISGVIELNQQSASENKFKLGWSIGSFGLAQYHIATAKQLGKVNMSTQFFRRKAINDFSYQIHHDLPLENQTNNQLHQKVLMTNISILTKPNEAIKMHFWWHDTNRQIPPTTTQNQSLAEQFDHGIRIGIHYNKVYEKLKLNIRSAYIDETNDYTDPLIALTASNKFKKGIAELNTTYQINNKSKIRIGTNYTHTQARSTSYVNQNTRSEFALFGHYQRQWNQLKLSLKLREQMVDGQLLDPIPAVRLENQFGAHIVHASVSRNFRLATLNDLYWNPGGNINLKPESGWSQEIGLKSKLKNLNITLSTYSRRINDWILWAPINNSFVYSPSNISKVWSRGLEIQANQQIRINESTEITWSAGYDYTKSTSEVSIDTPKINKGDQLVYVPKHQIFANFAWSHERLQFKIYHRYISATQGQLDLLSGYFISDLSIGQSWNVSNHQINFQLNLNNLWNKNYRVIERRPMPGRNIELKINFEL